MGNGRRMMREMEKARRSRPRYEPYPTLKYNYIRELEMAMREVPGGIFEHYDDREVEVQRRALKELF